MTEEQNGFSTEKQIEEITKSEPNIQKQFEEVTQI